MPEYSSMHLSTQGLKLIRAPYLAFQFSNLVQQVSEKNLGVDHKEIRTQEGNLFC